MSCYINPVSPCQSKSDGAFIHWRKGGTVKNLEKPWGVFRKQPLCKKVEPAGKQLDRKRIAAAFTNGYGWNPSVHRQRRCGEVIRSTPSAPGSLCRFQLPWGKAVQPGRETGGGRMVKSRHLVERSVTPAPGLPGGGGGRNRGQIKGRLQGRFFPVGGLTGARETGMVDRLCPPGGMRGWFFRPGGGA